MENKEDYATRKQELAKRYGIDFDKLEKEQLKLAKELVIKNNIDFSLSDRFGAFDNVFINNKLLSCIIVCDKNFEIIDKAYGFEKVRFPYVPGFRSYRELPAMVIAFNNLHEKPDVVFIPGQGIIHPRLGLASHFSIVTGVPSIGVSDSLIGCEINGEDTGQKSSDFSPVSPKPQSTENFGDILKDGKKVGKILKSKQESNPLYISPGNMISIESAYELSKSLINLPHKRPEPMHLAGKYAREVRKELIVSEKN